MLQSLGTRSRNLYLFEPAFEAPLPGNTNDDVSAIAGTRTLQGSVPGRLWDNSKRVLHCILFFFIYLYFFTHLLVIIVQNIDNIKLFTGYFPLFYLTWNINIVFFLFKYFVPCSLTYHHVAGHLPGRYLHHGAQENEEVKTESRKWKQNKRIQCSIL